MAKSSSLSMSTGEDLAFLRQEHRVEFAQDHLQGENVIKYEHFQKEQMFVWGKC